MFLPERKRVARTEAMRDASNPELRQAVTLAVLLLLPAALAHGSPATALGKYQRGRFEEARFEYERLLEKKPNDPELHFNAGAASFQAKEFETAEKHFQSALAARDLRLQAQAYYNLGVAQFRLGEEAKGEEEIQQWWERALRSFQSALKLNPKDTDAQFNSEVTAQRLEELLADQRAKARADDAVRKRNYKGALQIMEGQLMKNAAAGKEPSRHADYVKKLRDITNIVDSVRP
jgi:Ca-activated chloride channel family protein